MKRLWISIVLCSVLTVYVSAEQKATPTVQTRIENGIIEGITNQNAGINEYFGVPFAKPPVGELRWKAPQPANNWIGVLKTQKFAPRPVQIEVFGKMNNRNEAMSEDFLKVQKTTAQRVQ